MVVLTKESKPSTDMDDWEAHAIANHSSVGYLQWNEDVSTAFPENNDEAANIRTSLEKETSAPRPICNACSKVLFAQLLLPF